MSSLWWSVLRDVAPLPSQGVRQEALYHVHLVFRARATQQSGCTHGGMPGKETKAAVEGHTTEFRGNGHC
jgi:hypothetical protein